MIYASNEVHSDGRSRVDSALTEYSPIDEFLHAALAAGVVSEAHIYSEGRGIAPRSPGLQRYMQEKRLAFREVTLLPKFAEEHQYIWAAPYSTLGPTCGLRRGLGYTAFPICAIVHSIPMADVMGRMIADIARWEPCDAMIVTSRAVNQAFEYAWSSVATWLSDEGGVKITKAPWIERISIPVDLGAFGGTDQRFSRNLLQLPSDRTIVLCPGRVLRGSRDERDPMTVALKSLVTKHPQMLLVIGGVDGDGHAQDQEMLEQKLGVLGGVRVIADVPAHLKRHVYGAADIFVSTDDNVHEGEGLTTLEAMAAGLPVVVSDWGASRDLVKDGVNGYLVPTYWNPIAGVMMSWLSESPWAPQFLADRTIVDVRILRDGLDELLTRSERRIEFGQQARATVEQTRSLAAIGRQLGELWAHQSTILRETQTQVRAPIIDYTAMFRAYAIAELGLDLELRVGPDGGRMLGDELSGPDIREVPPLLRASATQILDRVRLGPVTARACVEAGTEFTFEAIVWLLRKGILSCDSHPQHALVRAATA